MTPKQLSESIRLYDLGLSTSQIAKLFDTKPHTVLNYLRRSGVEIRRQGKLTEEQVDELVYLYRDERMSMPEVGRELGIDHTTVLYHLKKRGVERRTPLEGYDLSRLTASTGRDPMMSR